MSVLPRSFFLAFAAAVAFLGVFAAVANAQTGVSESARTDVMQVVNGEVLDSIVIGDRVVVVGTFTQVRNAGGNTINQPYIAAYNATTGAFDSNFRPEFDNFINSIASDGSAFYVTGQFSNAGGQPHRRIAKINSNGSVNQTFQATFDSTPNALDVANGKVYVGGPFRVVNGEDRSMFAALSTSNGTLDAATDFDFSNSTSQFGVMTVRWIDVSPNGNFLFLSHSAKFIDGEVRSGIAKFDISNNSTSLSNWQTLLYDNVLNDFTLRMRRLAISPDGSYVVQVTSGGDRPPSGDTAIRFPTSGSANVEPAWISRHFDTVLGVAISDDTVFVGGHFQFQEAPGSDDPFPGNPDVTYDFGQNQGPQVLGDQVVRREQLGALDPATGKSLDWNPGSDSFIGVQSLTWDDELGLLVGHDGSRIGGVSNIGRHAILPIGNSPTPDPDPDPDPDDGDFLCTAAFNGGRATVSFAGDLGSSLQVRRNDAWAGTVAGDSITINANNGDLIEARLRGPNYDNPFEDIACTNTDDEPAPGPSEVTTSVTSPLNSGVEGSANVTITGDASATDGLDFVRVSIVRRSTGEYLTPDGSFTGGWTPIDVEASGTSSSWSLDVVLPFAGQYDLTARAFDVNGLRADVVRQSFTVGAVGNAPPELFVNSPALNGAFTNLSGSARDDIGVESVTFLVRNRDTQLYFRLDGTLGAAERWTATLSNPGGQSTNWSRTIRDLPIGDWEVTIDAFDTSGQRDRGSSFFGIR